VNFAIFSLAMNFFEEYKVTVSSKSSGGEHDSTGLRAKQKLITPLLRCASPETATLYSELFETTQQNKKGSHRLPFLHCVPSMFDSLEVKVLYPSWWRRRVSETQGRRREARSERSVEQTREPLRPRNDFGTTIVAVDLDAYGDAKLGDGGDGPAPNGGDGAGRATKRDLWFAARQGALS
jgi:hypothetical protein